MKAKLEELIRLTDLKADFERRKKSWEVEIAWQKNYFPANCIKWQKKVNLLTIYIEFLVEKVNKLKTEL